MTRYRQCNFCFRGSVTKITAKRRTLWQVLTGRPLRTCHACTHHLTNGYRYVNGRQL